jgi:hypothetical protein
MKVTLDHNVVIDFVNHSARVEPLREQISKGVYEPFVVEVGASEFRERGVQPDRYDLFEELLRSAGLEAAPRLAPLAVWDVFFWDHALWGDENSEVELDRIEKILFGDSQAAEAGSRAWLNRKCDVLSLWCHIHYGNEIFVTSDGNFHKATKLPRLIELGARRTARPEEL